MDNLIPNPEDWSITVTVRELVTVLPALHRMHRGRSGEAIAWLTRNEKKRLWSIGEFGAVAWFTADSESTDPDFALPLPMNFLDKMLELAMESDSSVVLGCDANDGSLVATCGERYISIDHPEGHEFTAWEMPYQSSEHGDHNRDALCSVAMSDAATFAKSVSNIGVDTKDEMPPFTTIAVGDGRFSWTTDWTRFGGGRVSGSVPARTKGEFNTELLVFPVTDVLSMIDTDETDFVRFYVDSDDPDYLYVVGDTWGVRTILNQEHLVRWTGRLHRALSQVGFDIEPSESIRIPAVTELVDDEGRTFYVSLHPGFGTIGDYVRFSFEAGSGTEPTFELFAEINKINDTLVGAQLVYSDGLIVLTSDFPVEVLKDLAPSFAQFSAAMDRTNGFDSFLPLFAHAATLLSDDQGESTPDHDTEPC